MFSHGSFKNKVIKTIIKIKVVWYLFNTTKYDWREIWALKQYRLLYAFKDCLIVSIIINDNSLRE